MDSPAAKIVVVVLAIIGGLVLLGAVSMLFMHDSMMSGFRAPGLWSSMAGACRGMMVG